MSKTIFAVLPFLFLLPIAHGQSPLESKPSGVSENLINFVSCRRKFGKVDGHGALGPAQSK